MTPAAGRWLRRSVRVLAVAGVILAIAAVRVVDESQRELAEARAAERAADMETAILHYRRAASWYAPANPYPVDALDRLAAIGARAEDEGDVTRALSAFRAVRAAVKASRSFYTPNEDRLAQADARIAALIAADEPAPMDADDPPEQVRRAHLALLSRTTRPSAGWTVVLLVGFATWVGGAFAFSVRALDAEDHLVATAARTWGTAVVVGLGLFVLGLALA